MPPIAAPLESGYQRIMDTVFAHWPGPQPTREQLQRCKLISHRGEHSRSIPENTLPAFDVAAEAGVWGLEMDLRWTRDLVPVISHDPDLRRLFQDERRIDAMTFDTLRSEFALVPSLAEVVSRYGGRAHLMIEIKDRHWAAAAEKNHILQRVLAPLKPTQDYHLIALTPAALAPVTGISRKAMALIAYHWPGKWYRQVMGSPWGGLCGHYTMMPTRLVRRLKQSGKSVGTGYAGSRNCLFREIRRGIDWIFSNNAVELQKMIRTVSDRRSGCDTPHRLRRTFLFDSNLSGVRNPQ